jgi:hypothetical protein
MGGLYTGFRLHACTYLQLFLGSQSLMTLCSEGYSRHVALLHGMINELSMRRVYLHIYRNMMRLGVFSVAHLLGSKEQHQLGHPSLLR